jgi:hypothetical protein
LSDFAAKGTLEYVVAWMVTVSMGVKDPCKATAFTSESQRFHRLLVNAVKTEGSNRAQPATADKRFVVSGLESGFCRARNQHYLHLRLWRPAA